MTTVTDQPTPATTPAPAARHRYPGTYWALVLGMGLSRIGAVLVPFLTLYLVSGMGLSATTAAQISAVWGAGWLLSQPIAGILADRIGRKAAIVLTLLICAAAYIGLASTTSVPALMAMAALIGLTFDAPRPVVSAWIADLVPADRASASYGINYWLINLGGAGGSVLGSYLSAGHLTWLCLTDAAVCIGFAALVLTLPTRPVHAPKTAPRVPLRNVLTDLRLLTITVLSLLTLVALQQYSYGLPLTLRATGLPVGVYGTLIAVNCLAVLALQPLLQPLISRVRPLLMCAAGAAAIATGMAGNALAHHTAGFVVCTVTWTLGEVLFYSSAQTYVAVTLAPQAARGRYLGVWGVSLGSAGLLAPLIGAVTLTHGVELLWVTTGTLAAGGALGLLALAVTRVDVRRTPFAVAG